MSVVERNWQTTRPTIRERSKFMFNNDLFSDVKCNERFCARNYASRDGYELTAWVLWNTGTTADGLVLGKAR